MGIEPFFNRLGTVLQNTGQAYFLGAIIGDCFCPACKNPVEVGPPVSGDHFYGQCKCGHYIEAKIVLTDDGRFGKFEMAN